MKTYKTNKNTSNNKAERNAAVCEKYLKYTPISSIAKEMHMGKTTIRKILKENNIYDPERIKHRLTLEKIHRNEIIINMYATGMSSRQIANVINGSSSNVSYVLKQFAEQDIKQYDVDIKNKENFIRHRKYEFDINFFKKIDTEEKAYWLGFLYADGCITDETVTLELQKEDYIHLEKFKQALKTSATKEIKYPKNRNSCLLYFNSTEMVKDLTKLGCCKNKTFTILFPSNNCVPDYLIHHFMRGYFDGDGCIYTRKNKKGVNTFSVIGNCNFINKYKETLFKGIGKKNDCKNRIFDNNITAFSLGGNKQICKIYNFLYKNANIFLERKYNKFKEIINEAVLKQKATEVLR